MAKSFLVSPGRAYLVIAEEGTKIVRTNGTLIDTVPEGANSVSITVDSHEIIVMDNSAKIQQLYNGNSGSNGIMTTADGETEGTWKIEIVSSLPEEGSPGVIYMVRTNRTGTDRYDDYIWIPEDHAYELLGRRPEASSVDLSNVAKTDEENTFTKGQRITGTLYATKVTSPSIEGTDWADFSSLDADAASIANLSATTVSIQHTLYVNEDADVTLPGMSWQRPGTELYVQVDIPLHATTLDAKTVQAKDLLTASAMFALASGSVQITDAGFVMQKEDKSITISETGIRLNDTATSPESPVFSVTERGEVIASAVQALTVTSSALVTDTISVTQGLYAMDGPVVLGGKVSVLDTLVVNNLDILGSVSGIGTGGGGSQSNYFASGVSVVGGLTSDVVHVRNLYTSYINDLVPNSASEMTTLTMHASTVWCLNLGSDPEHQTNYVSLVSPIVADEVAVMRSLKVGAEYGGVAPALNISLASVEGSSASHVVTLNVAALNVKALATTGQDDFNARATAVGLSIKCGDWARMFVGTDTQHSNLYGLYYDPSDTTTTVSGDTLVPTLLVHGMTTAEAAIFGNHNGAEALFAVNRAGVYLDAPARSYHGKDITARYYNASDTPQAGYWNELFPSRNTAMANVATLDLSASTFGLDLSSAQLRPLTTAPYPHSVADANPDNDVIVSSVEFGFTTGPDGLTVTWPADAVWPDEPNRIPPTQFEPNMCYRFVCRLEPVSDPSTPAYGTQTVTFKYVRLLSQTYSYPSPWATT